jgi:adenine-specific DNA-methyltransferase
MHVRDSEEAGSNNGNHMEHNTELATMKKLDGNDAARQSKDLVAEAVATLKALFPEILTEGPDGRAVNVDVLKSLVGDKTISDVEEKYGLTWSGKRLARQLALTPSSGTLRPCEDESVDWGSTRNLVIEGDNLEVLKLLQRSYSGTVRVIYIDPPYNTGTDKLYTDDFKDSIQNYQMLTGQRASDGRKLSSNTEASGRFHTDWLNMIYPRLRVARNLLSEDGLILISIDDHELENLRCVCNEVFGEENFIANFIWEKGRKNDAKLVSVGHEYVLLFARSLSALRESKTVWREEKPGAREIWDKYVELRGQYGPDNQAIEKDLQAWFAALPKNHPSKKWSRYKRVDEHGPWRDRDISWPGGGGPRYDVKHPKTHLPCKVPERGWIYATPEEMQRQIKLGLVEFRDDHTEPPFRKAHIRPFAEEVEAESELEDETVNGNNDEEELATQVRGSYFYKQSQVAVKFLRKLLGAKAFNNPKDHLELAKLFNYVTENDPNAVFLDFFAGSGSTGHAAMELNQDDKGNRRFILVQLPEQLDLDDKEQKAAADYCDKIGKPRNIAELTKERLRRAGAEIKTENPMFAADIGFRVYKLDSSNIRTWDPARTDLAETLHESVEHVKADRTEADVLYEVLLKLGLDLCVPIEQRAIAGKRVHSIGGGVLIVCLDQHIDLADVDPLGLGIGEWHKTLAPAGDTTCVFRDSGFADDVAKTNLAAILEQNGIQKVLSL